MTYKIKQLVKKTSGLLALAVYVLLAVSLSPVVVHADPSSVDQVQEYCKQVVPDKAKAACADSKESQDALTVATYHCTGDATASEEAACISKAESYLKEAADSKPKPTSAASFDSALSSILKAAGGSTTTPSPDAQTAADNGTNDTGVCNESVCKDPAADPTLKCDSSSNCDFIGKYVNPGINLLSLCFGLIAAGSIIMGGIQFSASGGDPQRAALAKKRIANTVFAIVAYFFLFGFLQFIIPGGLFHR